MSTPILSPDMRWPSPAFLVVSIALMSWGVPSFAEGDLSSLDKYRSCFLLKEGDHLKIEEGECQTRYSPSSSFKIPLSLMGFDSGILQDSDHPVWPYQEGYVSWLPSWKTTQTPKSWIQNSCVWYSQQLIQQLGMAQFQKYVTRFSYGNQDVSGEPGQNNGLMRSWLSSSLQISPREQLIFLEKMVFLQLPISQQAVQKTRDILLVQTLPNGWTVYGKTGSGPLLAHPKSTPKAPVQHGWFVGFAENSKQEKAKRDQSKKILFFVNHIVDEKPEATYAGPRAQQQTIQRLQGILNRL
jgi:beta-lactamase class D